MTALLVIASCACAQSTAQDELRSDLRSAISLASETELFIGQIETRRLLPQFRNAHADYLSREARQQAKEARKSAEKRDEEKAFNLCAEQLEELARAVASIRIHAESKSLTEVRRRVETIREKLVALRAEP